MKLVLPSPPSRIWVPRTYARITVLSGEPRAVKDYLFDLRPRVGQNNYTLFDLRPGMGQNNCTLFDLRLGVGQNNYTLFDLRPAVGQNNYTLFDLGA